MSHRHFAGRLLAAVILGGALQLSVAPSAHATIHPIIQAVNCASASAWANAADFGDPGGQTPAGLTDEIFSMEGNLLIISFPTPLTLDQSDYRALQATGFIDEIRTDANGDATALVVDLTSLPKAISGQGGAHCANAG